MSYFFITGLYRSGTTLLQKVLQNHSNVFSADQPLPNLYYHIKSNFYKENNISKKIVLGTLFCNKNYQPFEFINFINNYKIDKSDFEIIFNNAKKYSGVNSEKVFNIYGSLFQGKLYNVYCQLCNLLSEEYNKKDVTYKGTKEIIAEEYIPYFLDKGIKVLLIIRDIRDVINSLNYGKGSDFTGNIRPTLFNIRNWRKSVAYSIAYKENPNLLTLKYEDLVNNSENELKRISEFLNIKSFDIKNLYKGFKDHGASKWKANSSFKDYHNISNESVGKYLNNFNQKYINYIERLCLPELLYLKYETKITKIENLNFLDEFNEPINVNHKIFDEKYSTDISKITLERNRIKYLIGNENINKKLYFIFDSVAEKLKNEINNVK